MQLSFDFYCIQYGKKKQSRLLYLPEFGFQLYFPFLYFCCAGSRQYYLDPAGVLLDHCNYPGHFAGNTRFKCCLRFARHWVKLAVPFFVFVNGHRNNTVLIHLEVYLKIMPFHFFYFFSCLRLRFNYSTNIHALLRRVKSLPIYF